MRLILTLFVGVVVSFGQTYATHPRIWLTSQMLTDLQAKKTAVDSSWTAVLALANTYKTQTAPNITITNAVASISPTIFEMSGGLPWPSGTTACFIGGLTGTWSSLNNVGPSSRSCAKVDATHFSIPVSSSGFGAISGTPKIFINGNTTSGTIQYGYEGGGWLDFIVSLGSVYKTCVAAGNCVGGSAQYTTAVLAWLDYVNDLGAVGIHAPESVDVGFPSRTTALSFGLAYDWFYAELSAGQKTAAAVTANLWYDWVKASAYMSFATGLTSGNYWGGHILGFGVIGYATVGDNTRGQEIIDYVKSNFDTKMGASWAPGPPEGTNYSGNSAESWNYGPPHYGRILQYILARKTATDPSDNLFDSTVYAQRMAQRSIYDLHPDKWSATSFGDQAGDYSGIYRSDMIIMLAYVLSGTTEGAWAQYIYQNLGTPPTAACPSSCVTNIQQPTLWQKFLFYRSAATATSYSAELPAATYNSDGHIIWRSDWTSSAVWSSFVSQPRPAAGLAGHGSKDSGHIEVWRGSDPLIINAQFWKGTTGFGGTPYNATALQSPPISALYYNDQGQYMYTSSAYVGGQGVWGVSNEPQATVNSNYAYSQNQFSSSYDKTPSDQVPANRVVQYWFRSYAAVGDGTFFVLDRVKSLAATGTAHTRNIRYHLPMENVPVVASNTVSAVSGTSKIYIKPLNLTTPSVSATNRDIATSNGSSQLTYIAEFNDTASTTDLNILSVIYATTAAGTLPTTTQLTSSVNAVVAQVADTTPKVFAHGMTVASTASNTYSAPGEATITFTSTHSGTARYVIGGLINTAYTVTKNGAGVSGSPFSAGASGTITFTSTAGDIVATAAPAIIVSPSTISRSCTLTGTAPATQQITISTANMVAGNWTVTSNAAWLTTNVGSGSGNGSFTVTPSCVALTAGNYDGELTVTMAGADNSPLVIPVALHVYAPPTITTDNLPSGSLSEAYSSSVEVSGGQPLFSFVQISGTMCTGLTLSESGIVSGTPTTVQTCSFTVEVTDAGGVKDSNPLTLTINNISTVGSLISGQGGISGVGKIK